MKKAILGQEAVAAGYGLGRVTALCPDDKLGVTPYVAGYQMIFDAHNVQLVPIPVRDEKFRAELLSMNISLGGGRYQQDVDEIMELSLNDLRKELFVERASNTELRENNRKDMDHIIRLETELASTAELRAALRTAFENHVA